MALEYGKKYKMTKIVKKTWKSCNYFLKKLQLVKKLEKIAIAKLEKIAIVSLALEYGEKYKRTKIVKKTWNKLQCENF